MVIRLISHVLVLLVVSVVCSGVQYFKERPQDTTVIQGQTAVLKCVIGNRVGATFWNIQGVVTGHGRNVPAHPRHTINKDPVDDFSLTIVNTQLSDDGIYECQVVGSASEPPLRGRANLTVLVPSQPPRILGYSNSSKVEVPHTQTQVDLKCEAGQGRPAANIEWFRNGQKISQNADYSVVAIPNDKRQTAHSTITVSLSNTQEQNGAVYRCEAKNQAMFGPPSFTEVTLDIKLTLSGYGGEAVRVNDTLVLSCQYRGGNPLARLSWFRNGEAVDVGETRVSFSNESINIDLPLIVKASDNAVIYQCRLTNPVMPQPLTAEYRLAVYFPPASVSIRVEPTQPRVGSDVQLLCTTTSSNPAAEIVWLRNGHRETGVSLGSTDGEFGGKITTSRLNFQASPQDHYDKYECRATNRQLNQSISDTVTLNILPF